MKPKVEKGLIIAGGVAALVASLFAVIFGKIIFKGLSNNELNILILAVLWFTDPGITGDIAYYSRIFLLTVLTVTGPVFLVGIVLFIIGMHSRRKRLQLYAINH